MIDPVNQHQCRACALKHLSSALAIAREITTGYDTTEYHVYLMGNLAEAQEQLALIDPGTANEIRRVRLHIFGDGARGRLNVARTRMLEMLTYRFAAALPTDELPESPVDLSHLPVPKPLEARPCNCRKSKEAPQICFTRPDGSDAGLEHSLPERNAALFMVFSGPSLLRQDISLLKRTGIRLLSVNNAPSTLLKNGIAPHYWIAVDPPSRFLAEIFQNPSITKLLPHGRLRQPLWDAVKKRRRSETPESFPHVYGYRLADTFDAASFFSAPFLQWGDSRESGGARSVFLAALGAAWRLGYRRLYLLGADFRMTEESPYHFEEFRSAVALKHNNRTYDLLRNRYLPQLEAARPEGLEIYNCSPGSALDIYPFMEFESAVAHEETPLAMETRGLYKKLSEKEVKNGTQR